MVVGCRFSVVRGLPSRCQRFRLFFEVFVVRGWQCRTLAGTFVTAGAVNFTALMASAAENYELVFALAGPLFTDLEWVGNELQTQLHKAGYSDTAEIRISALIDEIARKIGLVDAKGKSIELRSAPEDERLLSHMEAGTAIRRRTRDGAALAMAAIQQVLVERQKRRAQGPSKTAYIIRSLKHPDEVNLLRRVYGPAFFLIGVSAPRDVRIRRLAQKIASDKKETSSSSNFDQYMERATTLIDKDEREDDPLGQQLRATFQLADIFISVSGTDAQSHPTAARALKRFVELLLSDTEHTPTIDEMMMFHAFAASLRSGALGRQVGAVLTTDRGELLATGCNDVPRAEGGLYWPDDHHDERDIRRERDSVNERADANLAELLNVLREAGWLSSEAGDLDAARTLLRPSRIMNLLEFGRTTHAEMEAIVAAARIGVSVHDRHLYTTTFPCHECARLIVTAGIRRVVYIEPYPKSLALDLHADAIHAEAPVVQCSTCESTHRIPFVAFEGIGPRRFADLFSVTTTMGRKLERKDERGYRRKWTSESAEPRLPLLPISYIQVEQKVASEFQQKIGSADEDRR